MLPPVRGVGSKVSRVAFTVGVSTLLAPFVLIVFGIVPGGVRAFRCWVKGFAVFSYHAGTRLQHRWFFFLRVRHFVTFDVFTGRRFASMPKVHKATVNLSRRFLCHGMCHAIQ